MARTALCIVAICLAGLVSGYAVCSSTYDCHYAAYGGSRQRVDMVHGRVASAFRNAEMPHSEADMPDSEAEMPHSEAEMIVAPIPDEERPAAADEASEALEIDESSSASEAGLEDVPADGPRDSYDDLPSDRSVQLEILSEEVASSLAKILEFRNAPRQPLGEGAAASGPFRLVGGDPE